MRRFSRYIATLGVAAGIGLATFTAASAQTWTGSWYNGGMNSGWGSYGYGEPMVSAQVGLTPGYYAPGYVNGGPLIGAPVAGRVGSDFYAPGAFASRTCVFDEGYGRRLPCDYNGVSR